MFLKMKDFIDRKAITVRLKELVEKSDMSQKDFAACMNIAQPTLSQVISGGKLINLETINKILYYAPQHLGEFDISWFLFGDGSTMNLRTDGNSPTEQAAEVSTGMMVKQAEEIGRLRGLLEQNKPKVIERILVFYSDNSVATYTLAD